MILILGLKFFPCERAAYALKAVGLIHTTEQAGHFTGPLFWRVKHRQKLHRRRAYSGERLFSRFITLLDFNKYSFNFESTCVVYCYSYRSHAVVPVLTTQLPHSQCTRFPSNWRKLAQRIVLTVQHLT